MPTSFCFSKTFKLNKQTRQEINVKYLKQQFESLDKKRSFSATIDWKSQSSVEINAEPIVHIWLNKRENVGFLGPQTETNKQRLIKQRKDCTKRPLYLISNYQDDCFGKENHDALLAFCDQYHIRLLSTQTLYQQILSATEGPDKIVEQLMIHIIEREIHEPYGNLAAASDLLRSLSCVIPLGIYKDFDIELQKEEEAGLFSTHSGFIVRLSLEQGGRVIDELCNDIFWMKGENGQAFMRMYRYNIVKNYLTQRKITDVLATKTIARANKKPYFTPSQMTAIKSMHKASHNTLFPEISLRQFILLNFSHKNPEACKAMLLKQVIDTSGPGCMLATLNAFLNTSTAPTTTAFQQLSANFHLTFGFKHQDASWVKTLTQTKPTLRCCS